MYTKPKFLTLPRIMLATLLLSALCAIGAANCAKNGMQMLAKIGIALSWTVLGLGTVFAVIRGVINTFTRWWDRK